MPPSIPPQAGPLPSDPTHLPLAAGPGPTGLAAVPTDGAKPDAARVRADHLFVMPERSLGASLRSDSVLFPFAIPGGGDVPAWREPLGR